MASLSLPRVLQLKKNSVDAEREQFEKFQTLAIQKAINSIETPVKEKHVRSTIIGTFQDQSAITYWMVALRQPLQDNRIVAWKFCHVTHKLLREGHPACLDDSQRHIGMIENLGKLWVHLREGYGRLIHLYTNLLATKLKFHARNPRFPGNMQVTADELDSIAENDVNNYFQICVELFDYMDDILILQAAVFESLGNARANSMTASGQCRLAALIPCAQDASHVYDCGVRLLFRLHASLPPDTLSGHRERFRQQFKKLSSFYKHASSLQYYRNLLSLPVLPANPPNFLLQSDFGTYVTPVVSIPEQPPDEVDSIGSLIDTSDTASQMTSPDHMDILDTRTTPSPVPDPIIERDRLIDHLQNELKRMRSDVSQIVQERNTMLGSMREHCTRMESQLRATKNELEDEKQKLEILSVETPEIKKKLTETEEKAKVSDEKFQKLKGAYTQLREEHISLIRQKAEVDKATANLRAAAAQHESAKTMLQQQLNDRMKDVELLQQSASSSEEVDAYKTEISNLRSDLEQSRQKELELESLRASMEALEIEHKTALTEQQEKLSLVSGELKEATENVEKYKQEVGERDIELNKIKEELIGLRQKSGDEYKRVVEEKEMALTQLSELTQQYNQEKEMHTQITNDLQTELDTLQRRFTDVEQSLLTKCQKLEDQLCIISREYEDVLLKKDIEVKDTAEKLFGLQNELKQEIDSKDHEMSHLMSKFDEATKLAEEQKIEFDEYKSENSLEMTMLQNTIVLNEKYIQDIISELLAKEEHIKNIEMDRENLNLNVLEHTDKLEAMKNYIIANQGELINIKKHHEEELVQIEINKNKELVEMNETIRHLSEEKQQVAAEFQKQIYQHISEQEVLENTIMKLKETEITLLEQIQALNVERTEKETSLKIEIDRITSDMLKIIHEKDDVITELNTLLSTTKDEFKTQMTEKENTIVLSETTIEELKQQNDEMKRLNSQINEDFKMALSEKENEIQLTEARLSHTEIERLNAECELQDLLQQNTILEADMAALKIQLEEANLEIKKKTSKLVSCAGETALEVTNKALSAFDNSNAQDANKAAAELAAKAFEDLARKSQIEGNEELVAKSAIFAAHNAAQVSAYVAEVSNVSTDMELSEKMNNECRNMLNSVKHCLEAMSKGTIDRTVCMEARNGVQGVARTAAGADRLPGTSVDDELADMDRAIEQAASQIEEMLAASRKGDTGVKLEVNEKILDACTTLMGAVKILVQDARKLQNEIGDPKTRQKMYRKNPQWSEGLISAGKAVVFAAKLLVSSADEAAGASGRVEGVSAAAHEVAGSTAQLVAASRARAPPAAPSLARLTAASRAVASAAGAVVAAVRGASALVRDQDALDTSSLSLTATRRLEMESKVRALELESALDAERARLAALRKRHYHLAQLHENGNVANGDE